jgi:lysophospholipase L1-like esterase
MWKSGTMLALYAVLLAACRANVKDHNGDGVITVLCVGDSNTDTGGKADSPKWCEFVAQHHPDWKFVNGGVARAKAAGDCLFCGHTLLASALESVNADVVILALGTNDMQKPSGEAVDALLSLRNRAAQTHADVLIATIPPVFYENAATVSERIDAANALLAQHVAPARLVDFFSDMRREDFYPDGLHINASGQHKRAVAVEKALKNL